MKIVVVDDDALIRNLTVDALTYSVNREVKSFDSGQKAWRYLESGGGVHMLISDIDMPEMDGITLLKHVKNRFPDIIFIAMSGVPEHETVMKKNGADGFIGKPFDINDLFDLVQHYVVGS